MARRTFQLVLFEPALWSQANLSDGDSTVLSVSELAPEGSPRKNLRTKVFSRAETPHEAFNAFNGVHDVCRRYMAYAESDEGGADQTDTEQLQEQIYVSPSYFHAYELRRIPGMFYATSSESLLKQIFRRYRETNQRQDVTFNQRVVQIADLELALRNDMSADTVGYTFRNVSSETTITSMDVEGSQMGENQEVQDAKNRAESIRFIKLDLQIGEHLHRIRIGENGSVSFAKYPGDETALAVLDLLEQYMSRYSETESVVIGQSRIS